MNRSTPGLPVHHQLLEFTQTLAHPVGDAIQPSHPLSSLLLLPPIPPTIRVFSNESTLHIRWPKYWSFSFSISPSNEHPGLLRVSKFCMFKNKLMSHLQKAKFPSLCLLSCLITSNSFSTLKPWSVLTPPLWNASFKVLVFFFFFNLTSSSDIFINESDFSSDSWMHF